MILAYHTLAPFKTAAMACIICYSTFLKLQLEIDQTAVGGLQGYLIPIAILFLFKKGKCFNNVVCGWGERALYKTKQKCEKNSF